MIHLKNSSDLDMGRRPELKSDEKREVPLLGTEISSCEGLFTAEKVLHLFGALPLGGARLVGRSSAQRRESVVDYVHLSLLLTCDNF